MLLSLLVARKKKKHLHPHLLLQLRHLSLFRLLCPLRLALLLLKPLRLRKLLRLLKNTNSEVSFRMKSLRDIPQAFFCI